MNDPELQVAVPRGVKTWRNNLVHSTFATGCKSLLCTNDTKTIHIITYNVHSLLADIRLDLLLTELADVSWDIVVITETWRQDKSEYFVLPKGNHFYGSGGVRGKCGIGFLIHKRWATHRFAPISERLGFLDIIFDSFSCRIFGVYMPQTSCPDDEI